MVRISTLLAMVALLALACAPNDPGPIGGPIFDGTTPEGEVVEPPITTLPPPAIEALRVPVDHFTIQDAVNAAQPGDLILIDPGIYSEEITISQPDIVIRGRDRETIFVDGLHSLETGLSVFADGVVIENLTVRNYTADGIAIGVDSPSESPSVRRVRVDQVTTSNTGRHGIVARHAQDVEITQSYTSGHGGAGVAIENCSPCNTVVRETVAEFSARGISLTGTDGEIGVIANSSRNNRVGIVIEDGESPTTDVVAAGNDVLNNGFSTTPILDPAWDHGYGAGMHVIGTTGTRVLRNRFSGNIGTGLLLGSSPEGPALPVDPIIDENAFVSNPNGDIVTIADGDVWTPIPAAAIDYVNGPVPLNIVGMTDADSAPGVPAGPVEQLDPGIIVVPSG